MKLRAAIAFFSRLPVGSKPLPDTFDGILVYFPFVGILIGILVAINMYIFSLFLPSMLCGFVGCLTWAFLTGGLHLDGVSDCGDGLFVETSPERRLEIMKDSRVGTFGSMALFFVLTGKTLALSTLCVGFHIETGFWQCLPLILICATAGCVSRTMNFIALQLPSARPQGLGDSMRKGLHKRDYVCVFALALFMCLLNGTRGIFIIIFVQIATYLLLKTVKKRIGGITGDVLGCLTETLECAVLFACCVNII